MFLKMSLIALGSQLVMTVADEMPRFDIGKGCKLDSASAFNPNAGMDSTIKRCTDDEQQARDQLQAGWSSFAASDRAMCISEAVGDKADANITPPSYVDLLTCLQDQQAARKIPKQ
jgi:hypothetical protein